MSYLVTGAAGFVGYHVCQALLGRGETVLGLDSLNAYYDVSLKRSRLDRLQSQSGFEFTHAAVEDAATVNALVGRGVTQVIHLAAQAGVRHSLSHPHDYIGANVSGFLNILEACRHGGVSHLVYASSSSVYGGSTALPFSEEDPVDQPLSLYAATKRCDELMAHAYSHLFGLQTTGLRFFTVYGPWGRPDMAMFLFTKAILSGQPIRLFNHGNMRRDFTFVSDIVDGVIRAADRQVSPPGAGSGSAQSSGLHRVYNLGNRQPVELRYVVDLLEQVLQKPAEREMLGMQPGDVVETIADISRAADELGYQPAVSVEQGIAEFVSWYRAYYGV